MWLIVCFKLIFRENFYFFNSSTPCHVFLEPIWELMVEGAIHSHSYCIVLVFYLDSDRRSTHKQGNLTIERQSFSHKQRPALKPPEFFHEGWVLIDLMHAADSFSNFIVGPLQHILLILRFYWVFSVEKSLAIFFFELFLHHNVNIRQLDSAVYK
jgi:hypothetical protein